MMNDRIQNRLAETVANRLEARKLVSSDLALRPSVPVGGFCREERPSRASQGRPTVKVGYSDLSTIQDLRTVGQNMAFYLGRAAKQNAVTWISIQP